MTPEEKSQQAEWARRLDVFLADMRQKLAPQITDIYPVTAPLSPRYSEIYGTRHWTETVQTNMRYGEVSERRVSHSSKELLCGIDVESGQVDSPGAVRSKKGLAVSEGLGPADWLLGAKGVLSLAKLASKAMLTRAVVSAASTATGAKLLSKLLSKWSPVRVFIKDSGMTTKHFDAVRDAVKLMAEKGKPVIVIVRDTNTASTRLIELGCPGKPPSMSFLRTGRTGVVTATTEAEIQQIYAMGHYVVDARGIARRPLLRHGRPVLGRDGKPAFFEEVQIKNRFWMVEKGQVLDGKSHKPYVGDYDLMGVAPLSSPGQNAALVASEKVAGQGAVAVKNVEAPLVRDVRQALNQSMKEERFLHGAQDQFAGYRGGATAFFPDGSAVRLADEAAVKAFYADLGRATRVESYGSTPGPGGLGKLVPLEGGKK